MLAPNPDIDLKHVGQLGQLKEATICIRVARIHQIGCELELFFGGERRRVVTFSLDVAHPQMCALV